MVLLTLPGMLEGFKVCFRAVRMVIRVLLCCFLNYCRLKLFGTLCVISLAICQVSMKHFLFLKTHGADSYITGRCWESFSEKSSEH